MAGTVRYWVEQMNEYPLRYRENGEVTGLYPELLRLLQDETVYGCELEQVSVKDGIEISAADALDMLTTGELDLVLGLPEGLDGDLISFPVYNNALTAIVKKNSLTSGPVENGYWGIDSALIEITEGTALEDHVLDFNGNSSLFDALNSHSVSGILVKRSLLDDYTHLETGSDFYEFNGIKLPYTDSIYMSKNAVGSRLYTAVAGISEQLKDKYASFSIYDASTVTGISETDALASYYNKLNDAYSSGSITSVLAYVGITAAVIFAALSALLYSRYKRNRDLNDSRLRTLLDAEPEKEMFEIDLTAKTIRAFKDFALFGVNPGSIPNPIKLDKLGNIMGYDFASHFSKVSLVGNTIYKNRFILHAGGKKLYIAENGRRNGHILTVTMTLINS